jgi:hypothetical protein
MKGTYYLTENSMYQAAGQPNKLLIVKRKHARPGMASSYILFVDANNQRKYCSSLYPTKEPNIYNIEYQGIRYQFIHTETGATIKPT